jgi:hypothetical protein
MVNPEFEETLEQMTKMKHIVRRRFALWTSKLQDSITNYKETIAKAAKITELRRQSDACQICPGRINSPDDAELIEVEGVQKLAHRFCATRKT